MSAWVSAWIIHALQENKHKSSLHRASLTNNTLGGTCLTCWQLLGSNAHLAVSPSGARLVLSAAFAGASACCWLLAAAS